MKKVSTKTPFFSILVPVYRAEKTLARCLDSILAQTFDDYEIIIYCDGACDNSGQVAIDYCIEHPDKIRLYSDWMNRGGVIGRKKLIEKASANYIVFVDADDVVEPTFLQLGKDYLDKDDYDMIEFPKTMVLEDGKRIPAYHLVFNETRSDGLDLFFNEKGQFDRWHMTGKIFKKSIFNPLPPDIRATMDDIFFMLPAHYNSKKIISPDVSSQYDYYMGIGLWSGHKCYAFREFYNVLVTRISQYNYNAGFLSKRDLYKKYCSKMDEMCDLQDLLNDVVTLKSIEDRAKAMKCLTTATNFKFTYNLKK